MQKSVPILYSFRRCPYAMRARLALAVSGVDYQHREVLLKDKPASMLEASAKGTVPVLVLDEGVLDQSLDIMLWALEQNDPENWLPAATSLKGDMLALIAQADGEFKENLDKYKYASRHIEGVGVLARGEGLKFLEMLEQRLQKSPQLFGGEVSLADCAIFPFIRQFANVDRVWFDTLSLPLLAKWLQGHLDSALFDGIMQKRPVWRHH